MIDELRIAEEAVRTDTGRQRNANEDSYFTRAPLFVVADGMGGAQAGEVASKAAVESFDRRAAGDAARAGSWRRRSRAPTGRSTSSPARTRAWPGWGRRRPPRSSTSRPKTVAIGHVGDSRAYRFRGGKLRAADPRPLAGRGDAAQGPAHRRPGRGPPAALDHHPRARPRTGGPGRRADGARAQAGDVFLICSDGLTTMLDDERHRPRPRPRHLAGGGGAGAGRRSQPGGRPRQHHRRRLPARGRRGSRRRQPAGRPRRARR